MSGSTSSDGGDGEGDSGSEEDTAPADGEDGGGVGGDEISESSSDGEYIAEN